MKKNEPRNKTFIEDINYVQKVNPEDLIMRSEDRYHRQIDELVEEFCEDKRKKIILVAGPSSSGKTTSTMIIKKQLEKRGINAIIVSLDDFFLDLKKRPILADGSYDYESINTLDLKCFGKFIDTILKTGQAKMPSYNFLTGTRRKKLIDVQLDKNSILLVEGLHALNPMLLRGHNSEVYKVYICINTDFYYENKIVLPAKELRFMRRCLRDYHCRNLSIQRSLKLWPGVLQGEDIYIKPYKMWADYVLDSTHHYELSMYAKYLQPIAKEIDDAKIERWKTVFDIVKPMEKSNAPEDSLLWEFLPRN